MKTPSLRRRRRDDPEPVGTGGEWTRKQSLVTTAVRWGLFGAIGAGALAFMMLMTGVGVPSPAPTRAASPVSASTDVSGQARAEDLALTVVDVWLVATRDDEDELSRYVRAEGMRLPASPAFAVSQLQVAGVEVDDAAAGARPGHGLFTVTVSAMVAPTAPEGSPAVRRYYTVPVLVDGDAARAAALPSPVAAPATASDVGLGYRYRVVPTHPVAETVAAFLGALTTGSGEISRYVSPGSSVRPITPAPFVAVTVVDLVADDELDVAAAPADGQRVRVLATVEAAVTESVSTTAQYALTVAGRGGRWEIAAVDPAPVLSAGTAVPGTSSTSGLPSSTSPSVSTAPAATPSPAN